MTDLIIVAILAVVLGGAAGYIRKAKKRGQTCIGCPGGCSSSSSSSGACSSCTSCTSCGCGEEK